MCVSILFNRRKLKKEIHKDNAFLSKIFIIEGRKSSFQLKKKMELEYNKIIDVN